MDAVAIEDDRLAHQLGYRDQASYRPIALVSSLIAPLEIGQQWQKLR
jgi:hypothetical protein